MNWESEAIDDLEDEDYVFGRTTLLLLKIGLNEFSAEYRPKPPPRPRRVSSAKPDTVNPPTDDEIVECFESEQTDELASDKMGSTPSTQSDIPPSMRGRFVQQTSDLLTLSHARVHDENETSSENDNTIDDEQSVKDTLHRSPMRGVHFKSSTLPRNREVSIFPQKGKYRFHRTSLSSDTESPSKINCDKLHQSDSPEFVFPLKSQSSSSLSQPKTLTSVSELFNKSKLKVRNSLKSWKFHGKSNKSIDEDSTQEPMMMTPDLYDVAVAKPEDFHEEPFDWLSLSHDSAMMKQRKLPRRNVIAVQTPRIVTRDSKIEENEIMAPTRESKYRSFSEGNLNGHDVVPKDAKKSETQKQSDSEDLSPMTMPKNNFELPTIKLNYNSVFAESNSTVTQQSPKSIAPKRTDSLLIQNMTGSPKIMRRNPRISKSVENLLSDSKPFYSPYCSSTHSMRSSSPGPDARKTPQVLLGESVSNVLSRQFAESERPSFDESANSEMNSFESSESHELFTSDAEDSEEVLPSSGSIRKAGWLLLKTLLVAKRGKLERPSKRKWQKYWVNLKGDRLLFTELDDSSPDDVGKLAFKLSVDGALVQTMPEHATKSNVFCLSLANGNVYLLQAQSQMEVSNWIHVVHVEASTRSLHSMPDRSRVTKRSMRDVLERDLEKVLSEIDSEEKMRKMATLQRDVVSEPNNRRTIVEQIQKWERNAERNHVHAFRLRCYLASLECSEQPNPQQTIAHARKSSKQVLNNLKCFNVATLHSLVQARATPRPKRLNATLNLKRSGSFGEVLKEKKNIFGSLRGFDSWGVRKRQRTPISALVGDDKITASASGKTSTESEQMDDLSSDEDSLDSLLLSPVDLDYSNPQSVRVRIADDEEVIVCLTPNLSFDHLLSIACQRKQLDPNLHFLSSNNQPVTGQEPVCGQEGVIRLEEKLQYSLEMECDDLGITFKQPKTIEEPLTVESVRGAALQNGIMPGDEILVVNGQVTSSMDHVTAREAMRSEQIRLLVQTTTFDRSGLKLWWVDGGSERVDRFLRDNKVKPPPGISEYQPPFIRSPFVSHDRAPQKSDSVLEILQHLVVPSPSVADRNRYQDCGEDLIHRLLKISEEVSRMCQPPALVKPSDSIESDSDKIWKVLEELIETEGKYVADLETLLHRFLEPLHSEGFLSSPVLESLLASVRSITAFQQTFLEHLTKSFPGNMTRNDVEMLNSSLLSVSRTFLRQAHHFKLYSVFCSCHTVAQDLVEQTKSPSSEVRAFLECRNPKQQHSLSLDSYLIKPIQRVLKYPLLLRELLSACELSDSETKRRLKSALHAMHAVARHINDSQTIHDEFGALGFREIMEQAALMALGSVEIASSLTLTELFCFCPTEWLNAPDDITTRKKKGNVLEMLVIVFRSSVVLLCRSSKQRKKSATPRDESAHARAITTDFIFTDVIPRESIEVKREGLGSANAIELTSVAPGNESRRYLLLCSTAESKQRLLKSVRFIIKESTKVLLTNGNPDTVCDTPVSDTPRSVDSVTSQFFYLPTSSNEVTPRAQDSKSRRLKSNRRSGLYINMNPQRLADHNFKHLLPQQEASGEQDSSVSRPNSLSQSVPNLAQPYAISTLDDDL